eukprot:4286765-Pyramimonas_sp.AAC.1
MAPAAPVVPDAQLASIEQESAPLAAGPGAVAREALVGFAPVGFGAHSAGVHGVTLADLFVPLVQNFPLPLPLPFPEPTNAFWRSFPD